MRKDMSFPHKKTSCYIQLGIGKMDGQSSEFLFHDLIFPCYLFQNFNHENSHLELDDEDHIKEDC